jgi:hypothetical protein
MLVTMVMTPGVGFGLNGKKQQQRQTKDSFPHRWRLREFAKSLPRRRQSNKRVSMLTEAERRTSDGRHKGWRELMHPASGKAILQTQAAQMKQHRCPVQRWRDRPTNRVLGDYATKNKTGPRSAVRASSRRAQFRELQQGL